MNWIKEIFDKTEEFQEGPASQIADGMADVVTGLTLTFREVGVAPLRIVGRMIDGAVKNSKNGIAPTIGGLAQGLYAGILTSGSKTGEALQRTGNGVKQVASTLMKPKLKDTNEAVDYEIIDES
ncbi:MAG: hypothetical protein D6732_11970 [Methanobacteriota archaeon]|nr:MAG: hypothetical protein D6732_11970 [Euryarchaeota archaeon]